MTATRFDVLAVGNAIVDVLSPATDAFLADEGIARDAMTLIDEERARTLYERMQPGKEASGGSAANTVAGIASLGGRAAYIGKVADDQLGEIFSHDIRAIGVDFASTPLKGGPATARCLINVTPDAGRSMSTFLGAAALVTEDDVEAGADALRASSIVYLEGYLFDREEAKRAYVRAAELAAAAGRKTALTLSDTFCVARHRAAFRHLVANHIDILLANEAEITALYETEDFDLAIEMCRRDVAIAAVTRSDKGAVLLRDKETVTIKAEPVSELVDTTGAGDLFAAGFLLGLAQDRSLAESGRMGAICAAEIISHFGARPECSLKTLAEDAGIPFE
ncbi:adenosine kinase [uncultured Maricaulis sp.]|uniref:adenosine kinase n=1 Tax=uncultured Maricaulis sp. TaxID=174710 RepID=UPI0030D90118|tara:strand:+ start:17042 stop:18049 length:1008 start_codon:yes stop_codon:yes gene_type:complete